MQLIHKTGLAEFFFFKKNDHLEVSHVNTTTAYFEFEPNNAGYFTPIVDSLLSKEATVKTFWTMLFFFLLAVWEHPSGKEHIWINTIIFIYFAFYHNLPESGQLTEK